MREIVMERGEIHLIDIQNSVGGEIRKTRPGIIVSRQGLIDALPVVTVTVVFTSSAEQHLSIAEHQTIRSTERVSTALCEQITTVDKSRVGAMLGYATDEEMDRINLAMASALGICDASVESSAAKQTYDTAKIAGELACYKAMCAELLDRLCGK